VYSSNSDDSIVGEFSFPFSASIRQDEHSAKNTGLDRKGITLKIKATIVYTQCFTGSFHAVVYHGSLFAVFDQFR
jgi:hypothetical protein